MDVGKRIKETREKRGLQQLELANKINISQSKMNKIETGYQKKIEPDILNEIAKTLGVTVDYLLNKSDIPNTADEVREPENLYFFDMEGLTEEEIEEIKKDIKKQIEFYKWKKMNEDSK